MIDGPFVHRWEPDFKALPGLVKVSCEIDDEKGFLMQATFDSEASAMEAAERMTEAGWAYHPKTKSWIL